MKLWSSSKPQFPDTEPLSQPMEHSGDTSYDQTVPQPLESLPTPPAPPAKTADRLGSLPLGRVEVTLYEALAEIRKSNRICPQPSRWVAFYRLLQEEGDGAPLPAKPLNGSAWASTPPLAKRMCFREQLEWADAHGCLAPAVAFLRALPDGDWNYTA